MANNLTSVAITTTRMQNLQKAKSLTEISKQKIVEKALALIGITDKRVDERTLKRVLGLKTSNKSSRSTANRTAESKLNSRSCA